MKAIGILLIVLSIVFFGMAIYKYNVYENNEARYAYKNVYVGGDAYNYIINANYFTGFCVLGGFFFLSGIVLLSAASISEQLSERSMNVISGNETTRSNLFSKNESHIYWCERCGSTYSGTGNSTKICPDCHIELKETSISAEDWRVQSAEGKSVIKRQFAEGKYIIN